jgi:cytochrome c553
VRIAENYSYGTLNGTHEGSKIEGPKMAKIAKKLTDTEIKSTKPADKEINFLTVMV